MKMRDVKRILNPVSLLCALVICLLLVACDPAGTEITTEPEGTAPAPETTEETTAEITDEITEYTSEDTREATSEESSAEPGPELASVTVYGDGGSFETYRVEVGKTLSAAALESAVLPMDGDGVRYTLSGWEYSISKEGERLPYDETEPPAVTLEGMHIRPVLEVSFRVRFSAGSGRFAEGAVTEFFVTSGESVKATELLSSMPQREDDEKFTYTLLGFMQDGRQISAEEPFTVSAPADLSAVYTKEELPYVINISTELGELIGGGTEKTVTCSLSEAKKTAEAYEAYKPKDVDLGDALYEFSGVTLTKSGREWSIRLNWRRVDIGFTVTLDYGDGYEPAQLHVSANGKVELPDPEGREDHLGYYDFVGWRDENGALYNGGYELTVSSNAKFTAEFILGEKKIYTVVFDTELGEFSNGSPVIVLTGCYGDLIIPPEPPERSALTFGEVVYEFVGWNAAVPESFSADAHFTALYKTEKPVYFINFYIDGELYATVPHYAATPLTQPVTPESTAGRVFSGWQELPETMPEGDIDLFAVTRDPQVVYLLDGEVLSRTDVKAGELVTLAAPAQKFGHTVSGWSTQDIESLADNSFTMPGRDVVFSARSAPNPHHVIYVIDGTVVYSDSVFFGEIYTVRGIEVKRGYNFKGWEPQDSATDSESGIISIADSDIVFLGTFSRCSYKVNYYLDGLLTYSDEYYYGETVTVRPDEEQAGCTFAWHSAGANITSGSFVMPAGNVDIYGSFSDGDNKIVFMIDGEQYGSCEVSAGKTVELGLPPTKYGYTFAGWSCDELDVTSGEFVMPEGDIILRGSFVPNTHELFFIDIATGLVINKGYIEYGAEFSLGDRIFCEAGKINDGWILLAGHALSNGDTYIMPDGDVIFGIVWVECLTLEVEEGYHIPYFYLASEGYEGCRYDEAAKTVYISDPAVKVNGASEGITVVYEYEVQ